MIFILIVGGTIAGDGPRKAATRFLNRRRRTHSDTYGHTCGYTGTKEGQKGNTRTHTRKNVVGHVVLDTRPVSALHVGHRSRNETPEFGSGHADFTHIHTHTHSNRYTDTNTR